ncbi:MAG TPA: hypothetical protein VG435_09150 [Acidimicrobiales bacterium]|nr:hypothetical protein [Acidimicrobiales bacterium]
MTTGRVLASVGLLVGLAGCTHTPGLSNGSVSVCYRAIPVGRSVINDPRAKLVGIHRIAADRVPSRSSTIAPTTTSATGNLADNDTTVCAMAFKGDFTAGQVEGAPSSQHGDYAIVVVTSHSLKLVRAFVVDTLPPGMGGRKY